MTHGTLLSLNLRTTFDQHCVTAAGQSTGNSNKSWDLLLELQNLLTLQNSPQLLNRVEIQTVKTFEITRLSRSFLLEHSSKPRTKSFRSSKPLEIILPPIVSRLAQSICRFSTRDPATISDVKAAFSWEGNLGMIRNTDDTIGCRNKPKESGQTEI